MLVYELTQRFLFPKKITELFFFFKPNALRGSLGRKDEISGQKNEEHGLDELELEHF